MTIKAIIIDVDGVIIGEKIGFNSPYPNEKVIQALKTIRSKGIPIILCTAKPHFSIGKVFQDANLSNYHITDGGGVIIDPVENKILKKYTLDSKCAAKVIQTMIDNNVYTEFYTPDSYFVQNSQESKITKDHNLVLQTKPVMVDSLAEESKKQEITKIMPIKNIAMKAICNPNKMIKGIKIESAISLPKLSLISNNVPKYHGSLSFPYEYTLSPIESHNAWAETPNKNAQTYKIISFEVKAMINQVIELNAVPNIATI